MALADSLVELTHRSPDGLRVGGMFLQVIRVAAQDVPHPVEPAGHAVYANGAPGTSLIPWADKHEKAPHGISAQFTHDLVGIDYVAAAFAHPSVVFRQDDALIEQP